jgi:hypothetical protein
VHILQHAHALLARSRLLPSYFWSAAPCILVSFAIHDSIFSNVDFPSFFVHCAFNGRWMGDKKAGMQTAEIHAHAQLEGLKSLHVCSIVVRVCGAVPAASHAVVTEEVDLIAAGCIWSLRWRSSS